MATTIKAAGSFAAMAAGPRPLRLINLDRIAAFAEPARAASKPDRKSTRSRQWLERDANERLSNPPPRSTAGDTHRPLSVST